MQLFDHLVGDGKEPRGHIDAKRLCSLEIDDELESHGLLDRQVARLFAFENPRCAADKRDEIASLHSITSSAMESTPGGTSMPSARAVCRLRTKLNLDDCSTGQIGRLYTLQDRAGINAYLMRYLREVGSVAHQPTSKHIITQRIGRRYPISRCQGNKLGGAAGEECIGGDKQGIGPLLGKSGERRINLAAGGGLQRLGFAAQSRWRPAALLLMRPQRSQRLPD